MRKRIMAVLFVTLTVPSIVGHAQQAAQSSAALWSSNAADMMSLLFVFVLASLIGILVISRVSRLLHTPLMSLTNAISAIAVVGSILLTGEEHPSYVTLLGAVALFGSMTNIVSGFLITNRMLKMFKSKEKQR
ncbi:MAG: NAD(P) transhydrogenase subunit alpha [Spirochaetia bacterium]